ncbi:MAG: pilus assembly protein PilP [Parasulfuritortus sp.]|nr:pilus assembly protein PilP [Parasulfuritortus sp.]
MRALLIATLAIPLLLAGCGSDEFSDLRAWMDATGKDGASKMEPLPEVKQVESFEYQQGQLQDPFMARSLRPTGKGGLQPDVGRPKQPLEEFPLDALRMVGTLARPGKPLSAIIKDPKGTLHTVQVGNRIGQNFGTITKITDDSLEIKELVQDGSGEWAESKANMTLAEEGSK